MEDAAVAELLDCRVDGIIYAAMSLRRVRVRQGLHHTPAVFANCLPEDDSLPAVIPAERAGGRTAVGLLLEHGHRRVAMIGGQDDIATAERLRGFREALRAEAITVPRPWVLRVGTEMNSGYDEVCISMPDRPASSRPPVHPSAARPRPGKALKAA